MLTWISNAATSGPCDFCDEFPRGPDDFRMIVVEDDGGSTDHYCERCARARGITLESSANFQVHPDDEGEDR